MDQLLEAMIGQKQQQSVAITNEERKLVAEEGEVRTSVAQTKGALKKQEGAAASYAGELDTVDTNAAAALRALLDTEEAKAKYDLSAYQQQQDRLRAQAVLGQQAKDTFRIDQMMGQIGPNLTAINEHLDHYQDKLATAQQEIVDTKNPLKWLWKHAVEKPYYEKKIQDDQQQILNTMGTAAKTFVTANNYQVAADNMTTKADSDTVVANVYNLRAAQLASTQEGAKADAALARAKTFGERYGLSKDITDQMQQMTQIIASTYNANKSSSLRASGAKGMEDILDVLKKYGELAQDGLSPGQIQQFADGGIDFNRAANVGPVARGMYLNHSVSDLPFIPSTSYAKEEDVSAMLANGQKAIKLLPSPLNQLIAGTIIKSAGDEYTLLKQTQSAGGDVGKVLAESRFITGERDTLAKDAVKKINGINLADSFSQKFQFDYGIQDGVPRTPGQFIAESALLAPGTAVAKEVLSNKAFDDLIASGKRGAKLAALYRQYADGKTAEGAPVITASTVLSFDQLRGMANNDAGEIFAFINEVSKVASLSLPYTAVGAKPSEFPVGIPGSFATRGMFGNSQEDWVGQARSEDDIRSWMIQADTAKKLMIEQARRDAEVPFVPKPGAVLRAGQ